MGIAREANLASLLFGPAPLLPAIHASAWGQVAKSDGSSSSESISYNGSADYCYFDITSYSGAGNYTLQYTFPQQ